MQAAVGVGALPPVDEQPGPRATRRYVLLDLIERHDDMARGRLVQLERQKRRGELARDGDEQALIAERRLRISGARPAGHDPRTIAVADARSVSAPTVATRAVGGRVEGTA